MLLPQAQPSDEAARSASLDKVLAAAPFEVAREGLWLFVYGILAADPPFRFVERRTALIEGRQRRFVLADPMNRGTPEAPGLVLGLEPGGSCSGLVYRIGPADVREALSAVWRQEMALPFYRPEWLRARTSGGDILALTMDTRRDGPLYRPTLTKDETALIIARASGSGGPNAAYLSTSIETFAAAGVRDPYLDHLSASVRANMAPAAP